MILPGDAGYSDFSTTTRLLLAVLSDCQLMVILTANSCNHTCIIHQATGVAIKIASSPSFTK